MCREEETGKTLEDGLQDLGFARDRAKDANMENLDRKRRENWKWEKEPTYLDAKTAKS